MVLVVGRADLHWIAVWEEASAWNVPAFAYLEIVVIPMKSFVGNLGLYALGNNTPPRALSPDKL